MRKHGHARIKQHSPTYDSWASMRSRVGRLGYGGRTTYLNITICERWNDFANFLTDMGEKPAGKTLDRIDNSRGYEPDNCRWATVIEQNRNKRRNRIIEHNGEQLCLAEWAERIGINGCTLSRRIRDWGIERALTTPPRPEGSSRKNWLGNHGSSDQRARAAGLIVPSTQTRHKRKRVTDGLCVNCPKPRVTAAYCEEHRAKETEEHRRRYHIRKGCRPEDIPPKTDERQRWAVRS